MSAFSLTIADGDTDSTGFLDLQGYTAVGVFLPSGFAGTSLTFQTSPDDGTTWVDVQDGAGSSYTVTVANSKYAPLDWTKMMGVRLLKAVAGTTQSGDSILQFVARSV